MLRYIARILIVTLVLFSISPKSISIAQENQPNGLTIFPEKGKCISKNQFKVFQVLEQNAALATEGDSKTGLFLGMIVLLVNNENEYYYDEQIIKIPSNKCARHIGILKYKTNKNLYKTVPVVMIE